MSTPYPQPQQPQPQQPYQYQPQLTAPPSYPGAPTGPGAHGGPPAPPAGRSKRRKVILASAAALVLVAAAAGGGLVFLNGGDGDRPAMAAHPDLGELPFPDASALGYEEGEAAHCAAVGEIMSARGYALLGTEGGNGITCMFGAPGTSQLEDGSLNLSVQVALTRGDGARSQYERYLNTTVTGRENLADDATFTFGELYEFPAGEEGFLSQNEWTGGPSGSATAGFRSGDDTFFIHLGGSVNHIAEDTPNEALSMDISRQEVVDIVKALSGDESAGEPRITPAEMAQYPDLPELTEPRLAEGASAEERCAAVTAVAQEYDAGIDELGGGPGTVPVMQCQYYFGLDDERFGEYGLPIYRIEVTEYDYTTSPETLIPTEDLGRDLQDIMAEPETRLDDGVTVTHGELYELPVGDSGFMIHSHSDSEHGSGFTTELRAGYIVGNGDVYMKIRITGGEYGTDGFAGYPEDMLVPVLTDVLTAMDR